MLTILSTRKPGFTSSTFIRLRPSNPAPITRINVMATCAATMTWPMRWLPCEPACPRPPSARPSRGSPEVARTAVNAPSPAATAAVRSSAKASTGRLIETLSKRGRLCGASASKPVTPANAPKYSKTATGQGEQEGFREELADQPSARGAQRAANRKLASSHRRLREQQIRHVRARHQ